MNTSKHTPGPWHLSECATQTTKAGIVSVNGLHITDVNGYGMTDSQNQANAHLIAAAPAMYEALRQSLVLVELAALEEWGREVRGEQQPPTTEARDREKFVKQALAQAEGK